MKTANPQTQPDRKSHLLSADESQRLSDVLARSQPLMTFLQAYQKQSLSTNEVKTVRKLLEALERNHDPFTWISTPALAAALPLLIRFDRLSTLSESEIQETMSHLVDYSNQKSAVWRALTYPIFMGLMILIFILILGFAVLPTFGEMYREFGLRLPVATRVLLGFGESLRSFPALTILSALLVLMFITFTISIFSVILHNLQFISVFGYWVAGSRKNVEALACWASVVAELIEIEFGLSHAIRIAGMASRSNYLSYISEALSREIDFKVDVPGLTIYPAAAAALPATLNQALFASPSVSTILIRQIAAANRVRFEERQERLGGLLGPLTTVAIGLFVGFVVLALFLPLVSLITSLT